MYLESYFIERIILVVKVGTSNDVARFQSLIRGLMFAKS